MKTNLKRFLSILMAMTMIFALSAAAFAADEGDVTVFFPPDADVTLKAGTKTTVSAIVENADKGAEYLWECSDPSVVSIKGSKGKVTVNAVKAGEADVSLTVTNSDGSSSDYDYFHVTVTKTNEPIFVSGGGPVKVEQGETKTITAKVTGGSGKYVYNWETNGNASLDIVSESENTVEVYAGRSGKGNLLLTVYDATDHANGHKVVWEFTVTSEKRANPPQVQLSRGTIDIGPGGSGSLQADVTGGSGNYDYIWRSDNPSVVSVEGYGAVADLYAAETLRPGVKNSAVISLYVRDRDTGLSSDKATCVVHVSGASATYDAYDTAKVGDHFPMNTFAKEMNRIAKSEFGTNINYSATIRFSNNSSRVGSICLQDDTAVRAGTSYTYATFQDMFFRADAAGTFQIDYILVDGSATISGKITLMIEAGGSGVERVSIRKSFVEMSTYSNEYLTLDVTPARAVYDVRWEVADPHLLTIVGSGNKVTVRSNGRIGTTLVTATVTDVYGHRVSDSCYVTVADDSSTSFDTTLTVMLGSDYYGSKLADSMSSKFHSAFGIYPASGATFVLTSLGNSRYGDLHLLNGNTPAVNRNYTFGDWIDMYFTPYAKGTYSIGYSLTYKGYTLSGTVKVIIEAASLTVNLSQNTMVMAPYSSQYITMTVSPASAYYRVYWASSDTRVVSVSGSNATTVINSVGPGTATVYAIVTDVNGIEIRRGCTVLVEDASSVYNPSVATTLGIPYVGTGTSTAMSSQFQALYGMALADNAVIRFTSTGNNDVGILRLADGSAAKADVDYTFAQYVSMYTEPVSAGTYSFPYYLTYGGKSLNGTVNVIINPASIRTDITLPVKTTFNFSESIDGNTGALILLNSISNTVGSKWGFIRFNSVSSDTGTLYLDRNLTPIKIGANVLPTALDQLHFVPTALNGAFTASYSVFNAAGALLGNGTLNISEPGVSFADVPADAYYAQAVKWAVERGITSGTGGNSFSPDMSVTRGQAVTFLWRAAGQPKSTIAVNPFTDVIAGAYYYDAVLWAVQQGITNGTSDTAFSPDLQLNRDQLLTFLCRANGGYAGGSDWSKLAVDWANARGLIAGVPGTFVANSACPRSDVVYYLWKNYNG